MGIQNCDSLAVDKQIGTNTLEYKICEVKSYTDSTDIDYNSCYTDISQISDETLGRDVEGSTPSSSAAIGDSMNNAMITNSKGGTKLAIIIEGEIPWNSISFDDQTGEINISSDAIRNTDYADEIESELAILQNNINNAINAIESNTQVQFCTTGRIVQGVNDNTNTTTLSTSVTGTGQSLVSRGNNAMVSTVATTNSTTPNTQTIVDRSGTGGRFPGLTQQMRAMIAASAIKIAMRNYYNKYDELEERRMQDYVKLSERVATVQEANLLDARREAARVACTGMSDASSMSTSSTEKNSELDLIGSKVVDGWNYKETITSTFDWETLMCHRCTRSQNCLNPKGGRRFCKQWAEVVEQCVDIQF